MTEFNENENVERIRQQEQPKKADEIKRAMNIGFHLKCLRCGKTYYHTEFAMSEMSYRMYSYCPDCIDKGIEALKEQDPMPTIDAAPVKHGKWFDAMVGELPVQVCDQCSTFFPLAYTGGGHHYCPNCGAKMDLEETK